MGCCCCCCCCCCCRSGRRWSTSPLSSTFQKSSVDLHQPASITIMNAIDGFSLFLSLSFCVSVRLCFPSSSLMWTRFIYPAEFKQRYGSDGLALCLLDLNLAANDAHQLSPARRENRGWASRRRGSEPETSQESSIEFQIRMAAFSFQWALIASLIGDSWIEASQRIPTHPSNMQNMLKRFQRILKHPKASQSIPKHSNASRSISKHPRKIQSIPKHLKESQHHQKNPKAS